MKIPFALILFLSCAFPTFAQLDSCNVFLLGKVVQAGINRNGAFGAGKWVQPIVSRGKRTPGGNPPLYVYCYGVVDSYANGFTGLEAAPDTTHLPDFLPLILSQEGWSILSDGNQANAWNSDSTVYAMDRNISGGNIAYSSVGRIKTAIWQGIYYTASGNYLLITQTTSFDTVTFHLDLSVVIKNIGIGTCNGVYYMRTFDPSNDVTLSGDGATRNVITSKLPNPQNKVVISTWGLHYTKAFLALATADCRARAFTCDNHATYPGDLCPLSRMDSIYAGYTTGYHYDSLTENVGVGMIYSLGDIAPHDSVQVSYTLVFLESAISSALQNLNRTSWLTDASSMTYYSGDTAELCLPNNSFQHIILSNRIYNKWTWSSPTGNSITSTTGSSINVNLDTSIAVLQAIGTSSACLTPDTVFLILNLRGKIPSVTINGNTHYQITGGKVTIAATTNADSGYILVWKLNGKTILRSSIGNSILYTKSAGNDTITVTVVPLGAKCYDSVVSNTWIVYNNLDVPVSYNSSSNITVYPNPFTGDVNITSLSATDQIFVYNMLGAKVADWHPNSNGSNTFNTTQLLPGMYIIRVSDKNGIIKARLPLQKL
jgi:hypothetical protein